MRKTLCVDVGGTKILVGSVDECASIGPTIKFESDVSSQEAVVNAIYRALDAYLDRYENEGPFCAIGISLVGRVDAVSGAWLEISPAVPSERINLSDLLRERYGIPAFIANDVHSATLAELRWGIGRDTESFAYLNVGTGIACRLVNKDEVISGAHWDAGEVGHTLVDMTAEAPCCCGRTGCVEAFASGLGMSNEAHRLYGELPSDLVVEQEERIDVPVLVEAWKAQDRLATAVVEHACRGIAALIEMLARISDPDAIVLGGSVVLSDDLFNHVVELIDRKAIRLMSHGVRRTDLNPATVALLGCAAHTFERI